MSPGKSIPFYQVDAFSNQPYGGNPAAVCLLDEPLGEGAMQIIAAEMNLSETAFVTPPGPGGDRALRWFTPEIEVPLCGHATLATSHVLLREAGETPPLRFETLSGTLQVHEAGGGWLRMDFPADPPDDAAPPPGLLEALGCPPGSATLQGAKLWIVRVAEESQVRMLEPDFAGLAAVDLGGSALGVSVTAPGKGGVDFVSRFFGPWVGVPEDPVTGVAHTVLGPYWARETGKPDLDAEQLSKRGGRMRVRVEGQRVHLLGEAVTVAQGTLLPPAS
jgi:PhzF family phenazine biosynthesis protein